MHFGFQSGRFFGDASFRVINRRGAAGARRETAMESHARVDHASGLDDFLFTARIVEQSSAVAGTSPARTALSNTRKSPAAAVSSWQDSALAADRPRPIRTTPAVFPIGRVRDARWLWVALFSLHAWACQRVDSRWRGSHPWNSLHIVRSGISPTVAGRARRAGFHPRTAWRTAKKSEPDLLRWS
jgi:hypothetical protein